MKANAINRLLQAATRRLGPAHVPTLHERRLAGMEAAARLRKVPKEPRR